jgi:hypothetical protein
MPNHELIDAFDGFSTFTPVTSLNTATVLLYFLSFGTWVINAEPKAIRAIIVIPNPSNELS